MSLEPFSRVSRAASPSSSSSSSPSPSSSPCCPLPPRFHCLPSLLLVVVSPHRLLVVFAGPHAPPFHPASSCSRWQLGVLLWWPRCRLPWSSYSSPCHSVALSSCRPVVPAIRPASKWLAGEGRGLFRCRCRQ